MHPGPILVIDVAHPPRHPDRVEEELLSALLAVNSSPTLRVIKVIHGYGSKGKGGTTRDLVRNWAFRRRKRIRAILNGEDYDLLEITTQAMRREVGDVSDADLGASNPGVTYLWVR